MRAERRSHRERLKKKRLNYDVCVNKDYVNRLIDTPKPCSCYMCGNPRKFFNEKTRQELKSEIIEKDIE